MTLLSLSTLAWNALVFYLFLYCAQGQHGAELVPQDTFYFPAILLNEPAMAVNYGDIILANWTSAQTSNSHVLTLWISSNAVNPGIVYDDLSLTGRSVSDVGTYSWNTSSQQTFDPISTNPWPLSCHFEIHGNDSYQSNGGFNSYTWMINKPDPDVPPRTWGLYEYGGISTTSATPAPTTTSFARESLSSNNKAERSVGLGVGVPIGVCLLMALLGALLYRRKLKKKTTAVARSYQVDGEGAEQGYSAYGPQPASRGFEATTPMMYRQIPSPQELECRPAELEVNSPRLELEGSKKFQTTEADER